MDTQLEINTRVGWQKRVNTLRWTLRADRLVREALDILECDEDRWRDEA